MMSIARVWVPCQFVLLPDYYPPRTTYVNNTFNPAESGSNRLTDERDGPEKTGFADEDIE